MVFFLYKTGKLKKAAFVFGEHARELVSPESGLRFLDTLCRSNTNDIKKIRKNFEIRMVLNANPNSRKKVENGEYCLRTNQNKVDLNRNWSSGFVSKVGLYKKVWK